MNLQVIASPDGDIVWVSGALPGAVHDKRAEWIWGVLAELEAAGLVTLADKGYRGSDHAKIPYIGQNKPQSQKEANRAHARLRAPGERAAHDARRKRTGSVSAEAACEKMHKAFPRKRHDATGRGHGDPGRTCGRCCSRAVLVRLFMCRAGRLRA
jgi:hypothetical protein